MEPSTPPKSTRSLKSFAARSESSLKRKALLLAILVILVSSILNALFGDRGLTEMVKARRELEALQREIVRIQLENETLLAQVRALKTDPLAIERLAREQLGLVKPDEVILLMRGSPEQ